MANNENMRLAIAALTVVVMGCGTEPPPSEFSPQIEFQSSCTQDDIDEEICVCVAQPNPENPLAIPKIICAIPEDLEL